MWPKIALVGHIFRPLKFQLFRQEKRLAETSSTSLHNIVVIYKFTSTYALSKSIIFLASLPRPLISDFAIDIYRKVVRAIEGRILLYNANRGNLYMLNQNIISPALCLEWCGTILVI